MTIPRAKYILNLIKESRIFTLPAGHPLHDSHEYACWASMHNRVRYDADYAGMTVQPEWYSFFNFLADLGNAPTNEHTLDRIEGTQGYLRGNVRWADKTVQTRNRGNTIYLTIDKETRPLAEWCELTGANYETAKKRYQRGWTDKEVLYGRE